jgi:hypothetical protein
VATELEKIDALAPPAPSFLGAHRRALVIGSRTALLMLVIAALAILGLGVVALVRGGGPEVDGMLRTAFGRVFGVVAVGMAVVLGVPAGVGLWSMAGATADDAVPALGATGRRVLVGVAIVTAGASDRVPDRQPRRGRADRSCPAGTGRRRLLLAPQGSRHHGGGRTPGRRARDLVGPRPRGPRVPGLAADQGSPISAGVTA